MKKTLKIDEKSSQKLYKNEEEVKIAFSFSKNRLFSTKTRFFVDFWKFTHPPGDPQEAQNRPWKKFQKKNRASEFLVEKQNRIARPTGAMRGVCGR